jgi:DNA uptake protein ComE-like DNA-binding protein
MIRKLLQEYYFLPRGEQRAMVLLSLLVFLTLGLRVTLGMMPTREPAGLEQFQEEAHAILIRLKEADSLKQIPQKKYSSKKPVYQARTWSAPSPVGLNKADSVALMKLPGIGPVFAGRIVKYRRLLGGYSKLEQLSEIYGMRQETLDLVNPFLVLDTTFLKKLKLNKCEFRDLLRHPYLEYEDVKALVHYIDLEGEIRSYVEIRDNGLLADSTLDRIAPYLDFTN